MAFCWIGTVSWQGLHQGLMSLHTSPSGCNEPVSHWCDEPTESASGLTGLLEARWVTKKEDAIPTKSLYLIHS